MVGTRFHACASQAQLTVDPGVQDGWASTNQRHLKFAEFVDCISTNSGNAWAELSDSVNNCYFDINFETNGRVIENRFQVTAPRRLTRAFFKVVVKALTFLGGDVQDFNRAIVALALTNGNAFIVSNTGWHNGVATNIVVINAAGSNKISSRTRNIPTSTARAGGSTSTAGHSHQRSRLRSSRLERRRQWIELFNMGEEV
jgi:hypothetical protein